MREQRFRRFLIAKHVADPLDAEDGAASRIGFFRSEQLSRPCEDRRITQAFEQRRVFARRDDVRSPRSA
jgi:hypothetical protein